MKWVRVRKALLMLFGLKKHDLCFLVTMSRFGEYLELYDYGDELLRSVKCETSGWNLGERFVTAWKPVK